MTIHTLPHTIRLTATAIAKYFQHRCDRLFRWSIVPPQARGKPGIGWNVPSRERQQSRPGIRLLMDAGNDFEIAQLQRLLDTVDQKDFLWNGIKDATIQPLAMDEFLAACRTFPLPRYAAQLEIDAGENSAYAASVLKRMNLDPVTMVLGTAKPDLLEFLPVADQPTHTKIRIWDFKASRAARHDHFIQVAFYSFLLESVLAVEGLSHLIVDTSEAIIYSRKGAEVFDLAPYRLALQDFMTHRIPILAAIPAADAHYHVCERCDLCDYVDTCRSESDNTYDLSRIPYITSESKRRLVMAGIRSHRDLAVLDDIDDARLISSLKEAGHDLASRFNRYRSAAQALEDGQPRPLETYTLQMPRYEDIRIIISAEHDPVTATCFALGIKTYQWDVYKNQPMGIEEIFIAETSDAEGHILKSFLDTLQNILETIDNANRLVQSVQADTDPSIQKAKQDVETAEAARAVFRLRYPRITKTMPNAESLQYERATLDAAIKQAKAAHADAVKQFKRDQQHRQHRLHLYFYDSLDVLTLKNALERHLANPLLVNGISTLIRLFPPESILTDADTFRTIPGTVVSRVLQTLVALPTPYQYDLRSVSERFRPVRNGGEQGFRFRPRYGFAWHTSNQIAFERIHDVWNGDSFTHGDRTYTSALVYDEIGRTIKQKLRAIDSIIQRLKAEYNNHLLLRKEPFQLYHSFDPLNSTLLEQLRVFAVLETSLAELGIKQRHTLPVADRIATFECLSGLKFLEETVDNQWWFSFDADCRDIKWEAGEFNLVLTPTDQPSLLLGEIDGDLFGSSRWKHEIFKVSIESLRLQDDPPRVLLKPAKPVQLRERLELVPAITPLVVDPIFVDYTTPRILSTLTSLSDPNNTADHIHELLNHATTSSWIPIASTPDAGVAVLNQWLSTIGHRTDILNPTQWNALRSIFTSPITLVWGPPGTGKTHTIAHILITLTLIAVAQQRPLQILVTAFTHHAINNVLNKVADLATRYEITSEQLRILKACGTVILDADLQLNDQILRTPEESIPRDYLQSTSDRVSIIGATVWSTNKVCQKAGNSIQPWYDVILIDEASQLKLPDALVAWCSAKPSATMILAGDDQQLPPIIQGTYPDAYHYMLTSVFAYIRHVATEHNRLGQILWMLEENFRMNEPLTTYPSQALYAGRFRSQYPHIRAIIQENATLHPLIQQVLDPDKPVILCHYRAPRSYTARNALEAQIAAQIVYALRDNLICQKTNQPYTPEQFANDACAVIAPHRAQNSLIRQYLSDSFDPRGVSGLNPMPLVDTVDKLQGQERDVVVVSYGVADEAYAESEAEFLLSRNRFNVAATRARHKLIVLCSTTVLEVIPTDRTVLQESMLLKEFRAYCSDGSTTAHWNLSETEAIEITIQWKSFSL